MCITKMGAGTNFSSIPCKHFLSICAISSVYSLHGCAPFEFLKLDRHFFENKTALHPACSDRATSGCDSRI